MNFHASVAAHAVNANSAAWWLGVRRLLPGT
ncbi:hypothetical protein JOE40_000896 [Arthrobacter sp. PvP102]|nr:hypothetical protein [Arthrobacter sp. PvP103]MBP1236387.1 hypothetical protein [Arthrobacter sp. PvP102]